MASLTPASSPCRWFLFHQEKLLFSAESGSLHLAPTDPTEQLPKELTYRRHLGSIGGEAAGVAQLADDATLPAGWQALSLRQAWGHLPEPQWAQAGRALQILTWRQQHRYCGRCGTPTSELETEIACRCSHCQLTAYPRLSPAVIMTITDGDCILLGRAPRYPPGMYSPLAGFVEAGETLEAAVAREVHEEVGLLVGDIRYFASQPWPFPHSLMLGFTATGDRTSALTINGAELEDARWFHRAVMPARLPSPMSISRRLIDHFLVSQGA